ncbi:hypothetical protein ALC57_05679 [Trachymyrmex cornetzi]|uniref:Secreted protein n=1 Tax=Trachymyrmex cornetzi TaxID=471704 RepID=A0A151JAA4_9HYME|nr:hypothetical protein ALC57_05679 [Trachymyrmex cornetzi]
MRCAALLISTRNFVTALLTVAHRNFLRSSSILVIEELLGAIYSTPAGSVFSSHSISPRQSPRDANLYEHEISSRSRLIGSAMMRTTNGEIAPYQATS